MQPLEMRSITREICGDRDQQWRNFPRGFGLTCKVTSSLPALNRSSTTNESSLIKSLIRTLRSSMTKILSCSECGGFVGPGYIASFIRQVAACSMRIWRILLQIASGRSDLNDLFGKDNRVYSTGSNVDVRVRWPYRGGVR